MEEGTMKWNAASKFVAICYSSQRKQIQNLICNEVLVFFGSFSIHVISLDPYNDSMAYSHSSVDGETEVQRG